MAEADPPDELGEHLERVAAEQKEADDGIALSLAILEARLRAGERGPEVRAMLETTRGFLGELLPRAGEESSNGLIDNLAHAARIERLAAELGLSA